MKSNKKFLNFKTIKEFILEKKGIYDKRIIRQEVFQLFKYLKKKPYIKKIIRRFQIKKVAKGLEKYNNEGDSIDERNKTIYFINFALPHIINNAKTKNFLDIGCGNGRLSYIAAKNFDKVISIDPYNDFNKRFLKPNIKFYKKNFLDFHINIKFDVILYWGSFYIMKPYINTLIKAKSMLSDNGIIVIADDKERIVGKTKNNKKLHYSIKILSKKCHLKQINDFLVEDYYRVYILKKS